MFQRVERPVYTRARTAQPDTWPIYSENTKPKQTFRQRVLRACVCMSDDLISVFIGIFLFWLWIYV